MEGQLDIDFEHFARMLFGDRYHHFCDWNNKSNYKKFLKEVSRNLQRVILNNLQFSDQFQKERIETVLSGLGNSLKRTNFEAYYIKGLLSLIFWILGDFPDNFFKKNLRGEKFLHPRWARTLIYTQSIPQKGNAILETHKYEPYSSRVSYDELFYKRVKMKNSKEFVEYYKEAYPDLYIKLF